MQNIETKSEQKDEDRIMELNFGRVEGLPPEEQQWLQELKYIYDYHRSANRKKRRYYNGKVTLNEVNLGIALPAGLGKLEIGCAWGAKTVDVLAGRSMFEIGRAHV